MKKQIWFGVFVLLAWLSHAEVRFAPIFNDGTVLQCEMKVNIWGCADPGEAVTVSFAGQSKTAIADPSGKWMLQLDPMPASAEPRELIVRSSIGSHQSSIRNVVVGEVWLATGQSNMAVPLRNTLSGPEWLEKTIPEIRFVRVPQTFGLPVKKQFTPEDLKWNNFEPGPNGQIAAVAFYFAEKIQAETGRQIGIIQSSYGGTPCQAWTPAWALNEHPELKYYTEAVRAAQEAGKSEEEWMKTKEGTHPKNPGPQDLGNPFSPKTATTLYENMIVPLVPYTARGVIWYQGEANAGKPDEYRILFPAMIDAWRTAWSRADWPFLFVQLAAYEQKNSDWAAQRAAQTFTRDTVPHTGMAVSIDCGEKTNIHPKKKQPVGERLARLALADVYGKNIVARGPTSQALEKTKAGLCVIFQGSEAGLETSDGKPAVPGFEAAGADGVFHTVQAKIISTNSVELTCAEVSNPVLVRYAWANWPEPPVTLQNSAGLPAEPFSVNLKNDR